jgi:hypothetical protein
MNSWGIPSWLEAEVCERDKNCAYCGVVMLDRKMPGGSRRTVGTWEHIINDARIVTRENIVRCCSSCNSSKGAKLLMVWLQSSYCESKGISSQSVSAVVKQAIAVAQREHPADGPAAAARRQVHG